MKGTLVFPPRRYCRFQWRIQSEWPENSGGKKKAPKLPIRAQLIAFYHTEQAIRANHKAVKTPLAIKITINFRVFSPPRNTCRLRRKCVVDVTI